MPKLNVQIVSNDGNGHIAIFVNDELIHQSDYGALDSLLEHLVSIGLVSLEENKITEEEYGERFA